MPMKTRNLKFAPDNDQNSSFNTYYKSYYSVKCAALIDM